MIKVEFFFTKYAKKQFDKLDIKTQNRIKQKLILLKTHPNIMFVFKVIHGLEPVTHRVRIGSHRLLVNMKKINNEETHIIILKLGHRRDIYT